MLISFFEHRVKNSPVAEVESDDSSVGLENLDEPSLPGCTATNASPRGRSEEAPFEISLPEHEWKTRNVVSRDFDSVVLVHRRPLRVPANEVEARTQCSSRTLGSLKIR